MTGRNPGERERGLPSSPPGPCPRSTGPTGPTASWRTRPATGKPSEESRTEEVPTPGLTGLHGLEESAMLV